MRFLASLVIVASSALSAAAAPITFIQTGSGSGSLGGTPFTDASFTITAFGDTLDREFNGTDVYSIPHTSATIEIQGLGTFNFVSGTRTFVNQTLESAGLSRPTLDGIDLYYAPVDAGFATWDMLTSFGPIFGGSELLQWGVEEVETSGGVLDFLNGTPEGMFQAIVPEPATWILAVAAAAPWAAAVRRRRRK